MQIVNNGAGTLLLNSVNFSTGATTTITNAGAGTLTLADAVAYFGTNAVVNLANTGGGTFQIGNLGVTTGVLNSGLNGTVNVTAGAVTFAGNTGGDLFTNGLILNVAAGASFNFAGNGEQMGGITGGGTVLLTAASVGFNEAGDRAFNGVFSGTGGVTQNVANVLSLGGANTYSGTTTIIAGATIRGTAANAFSPNSLVSVAAGGTLDPGGLSQTIAGLTGGSAADGRPGHGRHADDQPRRGVDRHVPRQRGRGGQPDDRRRRDRSAERQRRRDRGGQRLQRHAPRGLHAAVGRVGGEHRRDRHARHGAGRQRDGRLRPGRDRHADQGGGRHADAGRGQPDGQPVGRDARRRAG